MNCQCTDTQESTAPAHAEQTWNRMTYRPSVDIVEDKDGLTVMADMPGARREDIDIQFEKGVLTLHGRVQRRQPEDTAFLLAEYDEGDFHRTFTVSELIDASRITAEFKEGVLTLKLPKVEAARPRKIEVQMK